MDIVWSVNIMIGILLVSVGLALYYIFMYDEWYPNGRDDTGHNAGSTDSSPSEQSGETGREASGVA